jgi:2TM domain
VIDERVTNADERELRELALAQIRRKRRLRAHLGGAVVGNILLAVVWAITEYQNARGWPTGFRTGRRNHDWDPWIIYPTIANMVGVGLHLWTSYRWRPVTERDIQHEMAQLR